MKRFYIIYFYFQFKKKKSDAEEPIPVPQKPKKRPVVETAPTQHKNVRSAIDEMLQKEQAASKKRPVEAHSLEMPVSRKRAGADIILERQYKREAQKETISLERDTDYHRSQFDRTGNHFKEFDIAPPKKHPFVNFLNSKNGLRNAFIASEVLKPKHF